MRRRKNAYSRTVRIDGRSRRCRLERLEDRLALDGDGGTLVSLDPHFTLSFANDGTKVAGQTSSLHDLFDAVAPTAVWREQILRGFQTWAVLTNADIGLVTDGGQPFGTPGSGRNDPRFGDIRIGSIAADSSVGAVSVPVDNLVSGTWLADVLFNNQFNYTSADEILAVAMHEAGNVFGLEDNTNPNSPLFSGNGPVVNSPTAEDIAAIQSLHGARPDDFNEVHQNDNGTHTNNDLLTSATELKLAKVAEEDEGSAPTVVYGDITTATDLDYFTIKTPGDYFGTMTVSLRSSGISLLQPSLALFNAAGQLIAQASSQIIGGVTMTLQVPSVLPDETYFIKAAGADTGLFGIGSYSLTTTFDGMNQVDPEFTDEIAGGAFRFLEAEDITKLFKGDDPFYNDDEHSDDEAELGLELETTIGFVEGTRYDITASIADSADVDFYRIESPAVAVGPLDTLTVAIRSLDQGGLVPKVTVLDENEQPLSTQIIANGGGDLVIQVTGLTLGDEYFVVVEAAEPSGPFGTGNYDLQAVFTESPTTLTSAASGTIGGAVGQRIHTLHVGQPQLFHFVLEAGASTSAVPSAVVVTIKDDTDAVIAQLASPPGDRRSLSAVLMNPGTYSVEFAVLTLDGSTSPAITYDLLATSISDPFAGDPDDPTGNPFACPGLPGQFCYPELVDPVSDPFLWDDFIDSLASPPPPLELEPLVNLLLGDWWSWVWAEFGVNGPALARDDYILYTLTTGLSPDANVLANDIDPEGGSFVAIPKSSTSNGSLTLNSDGTLEYTPTGGFTGTDQFTYSAYDFSQESLTPGVVRIVVTSGLEGDYDADGVVDSSDYAMWKNDFGSTEELAADGNRDGIVNAADYALWRDNLGATLPAALSLSLIDDGQASSQSGPPSLKLTSQSVAAQQEPGPTAANSQAQQSIPAAKGTSLGNQQPLFTTNNVATEDQARALLLLRRQTHRPRSVEIPEEFGSMVEEQNRIRDDVFAQWWRGPFE